MTKELWINLPVKDVSRAKAFFNKIGFSINEERSNDTMAAVKVGQKQVPVMLFREDVFAGVIQNTVTDTAKSNEAIFSFDAETKQEVDEMAKMVTDAGGNVFAPPAEIQGWMYGCAFTDLDGHRWNILYMDMGKMPK